MISLHPKSTNKIWNICLIVSMCDLERELFKKRSRQSRRSNRHRYAWLLRSVLYYSNKLFFFFPFFLQVLVLVNETPSCAQKCAPLECVTKCGQVEKRDLTGALIIFTHCAVFVVHIRQTSRTGWFRICSDIQSNIQQLVDQRKNFFFSFLFNREQKLGAKVSSWASLIYRPDFLIKVIKAISVVVTIFHISWKIVTTGDA